MTQTPHPEPDHPLEALQEAHGRKQDLCDLLEMIADALPSPDRALCMRAAAQMTIELPVHHADEDLGLFPLLRARCRSEDRIEPVLDRLSDEHMDDEASMEEIVLLLRRFAAGNARDDQGAAAGYALRGFFEGQRRHIAWEEAVVMPLARARLSQEDLAQLSECMDQNRKGTRPCALRRGHPALQTANS
jgi:cytochrome c553